MVKHFKHFRIENGLEYCSGESNNFCDNEGIVSLDIVRRIPQ